MALYHIGDIKNSVDTAKEEGRTEIAKELLRNGVDINLISKSTGLSREQIEHLK